MLKRTLVLCLLLATQMTGVMLVNALSCSIYFEQ